MWGVALLVHLLCSLILLLCISIQSELCVFKDSQLLSLASLLLLWCMINRNVVAFGAKSDEGSRTFMCSSVVCTCMYVPKYGYRQWLDLT